MAAPMQNLEEKLLTDVHEDLVSESNSQCSVRGRYQYWHYGCDGKDDRGWGCGYRTLQSLCSWVKFQHQKVHEIPSRNVPSIPEIQKALVAMGDKEQIFIGSKSWIGSFEVCLCLDYFYNVPCKIIHVKSGKDLGSHFDDIVQHFRELGSPIMMGGDSDNSSKGVIGVALDPPSLLIMDPHYYGSEASSGRYLCDNGWVSWRRLESFLDHSFYNLCLPQLKAAEIS